MLKDQKANITPKTVNDNRRGTNMMTSKED